MKYKLIFSFLMLIFICAPTWAQKQNNSTNKTNSHLSKAEEMGYARTNKYWGPGTYYLYAPGKPNNKPANNSESDMRDLTGILDDDLYKEIAKQGFVEIPKKESAKAWFNETKNKDKKFYYSSDKSYVLAPSIKDMYQSPVTETGKYAFASNAVDRYVFIPKKDSQKVMDAIWQYLRDLNEMKVLLANFRSNFKKADPKAYPIQRAGSDGWTGLRAGSWALKAIDGKPKGYWEANEVVVKRTIGMPEFYLLIMGVEIDFSYSLRVNLTKEGYVLAYSVVAHNLSELEPGNTWVKEYPLKVKEYNTGIKMDAENVEIFKKAPFPPVLEDLNKILHLK